ncbi:MAG: outer membrane beta-barrel domain-containing protein [Deltaproteobacteria bacterium]|nr:outer membrane beta-barrel domain-containing protein [Deltaproteobacteria bacterium]
MKKLQLISILVALALAVPSQAADKPKTLKDRIKSVSNRMFTKSGRMELTVYPLTSISLNDAFYQKLGGGVGFAYHFSDMFSLQALVTYSLNLDAGHATSYTISTETETKVPYAGKRKLLAGVDFCWSPIYGKISLASEWIMHFDTYIMAGLGGIQGEQVSGSSFGFAGAVGLGARFFFNDTFALKFEIKDYMVFTDKVSFGEGESIIEKSDVQHQLLFNFGLSIFFLDGSQED